MGNLSYACLMPHPPIALSEVGGQETDKCLDTVSAMRTAAQRLVNSEPHTVVIITPHGNVFQDAVAVTAVENVTGDMKQFGASAIRFDYATDLQLAQNLRKRCDNRGIPLAFLDQQMAKSHQAELSLDHGVMVPLYYLSEAGFKGKLLVVAMGLLPPVELYQFGVVLGEAVEQQQERVAIVASGDLSHRLTVDAPAGFNPKGEQFDQQLGTLLQQGAIAEIVHSPREFAEEAGECGLRPLLMLLGCADGYEIRPEVLSYQGPFGVGYMVAEVYAGGQRQDSKLDALRNAQQQEMLQTRQGEHDIVRLARETLEAFIRHGKVIEPDYQLPEELPDKAGVFVSLKEGGQLRGCIGTIKPTKDSLGKEVMHNALAAGVQDPRFNPVEQHELSKLTYSVDVLHPPEDIDNISELNPRKYGVIVSSGARTGLLLPNLEGIDTAQEQLQIAKQKAGIGREEHCALQRFKVDRYY